MKNRLQFNRIAPLYSGATGISGREQANSALTEYITRRDFIPLIGEPIVVRYVDENGNKQAILAIGKATGTTSSSTRGIEYHVIDTAKLEEDIAALAGDVDALSAGTIQLSADTKAAIDEVMDVAESASGAADDYRVILKNIIMSGVGLSDGTYFDDGDPSQTGMYVQMRGANYISGATSLQSADFWLDKELGYLSGEVMDVITHLDDSDEEINELSAVTASLSANTAAADEALSSRISDLEAKRILGQEAITVSAVGSDTYISLKLSDEDKVLSQSYYGLSTNIKIAYTSADTKIHLYGKNNEDICEPIPANDFIKDGMISAVTVFTPTQAWIDSHSEYAYAQLSAGTPYLWITFNVDSPNNPKDVFLRLDDLVDVYTVSANSINYLEINDYKLAAKVDVENGLAGYNKLLAVSGLAENILAGTGLNTLQPGQYNPHGGTSIISAATSLDDADVKLDAAVTSVSGMIQNIDSRLSDLESEVGGYDERIEAVENDFEVLSVSTEEAISGLTENVEELYETLSGSVEEIYETISENVEELYGALSAFSGDVMTRIEEDGEVVAGALNDLNVRVGTLETHFTGEYIPLTNYEISTGLTEEELIIREEDTVNEAFGKIQKQLLDNEEAVAGGLNALNVRISEAEETIAHNTGVTVLSGAVVNLSNKVNDLSGATQGISDNLENNSYGFAYYDDLSALSSATQSISAKTSGILTLNVNGEPQGKYSPSANTTIDLEIIQEVTGADVLLTGYELASGTTEEQLRIVGSDTVNEAFGKIQKQYDIIDEVAAGALNDLDERVEILSANTLTGISVDGVMQPVSNNVASLHFEVPSVNNYFDAAKYDSNSKRINFYNGGKTTGTVIDYVDATDFIKDGMVSSVTISGESMVISFNTDAGVEDIELSLLDIFDPGEYFTSAQTDVRYAKKMTKTYSDIKYFTIDVSHTESSVVHAIIEVRSKDWQSHGVYLFSHEGFTPKLVELLNNGDEDPICWTEGVEQRLYVAYCGELISNPCDLEVVVTVLEEEPNFERFSGATTISLTGTTGDCCTVYQEKMNLVWDISSASTNYEYPTARAVWNLVSGAQTEEREHADLIVGNLASFISGSTNMLSASVVANESNIEIISGALIDNEMVIAAACNDLNRRIVEVSGSVMSTHTSISDLVSEVVALSGSVQEISGSTGGEKEIFWATYGSTTYATIQQNISDGRLVMCRYSGKTYTCTYVQSSIYFVSTDISALSSVKVYYLGVTSQSTWWNSALDLQVKLTDSGAGQNIKTVNNTSLIGSGNVDTDQIYVIEYSANSFSNLSAAYFADKPVYCHIVLDDYFFDDQLQNNIVDVNIPLVGNENAGGVWEFQQKLYDVYDLSGNVCNVLITVKVDEYGSPAWTCTLKTDKSKRFQTYVPLSAVAFDEFLSIAEVNASCNFTVATNSNLPRMQYGEVCEASVIIHNTGTTGVTVAFNTADSRLVLMNGNTMYISAGGYGEINALITYDSGEYKIYIITT